MGLLDLSPPTRRRVDRDAWILGAWWALSGVTCCALLLEFLALRSPAWRYPLTAFAMYGLGTVLGLRLWLWLFSRRVRLQPGRYGGTSESDRAADQQPLRSRPPPRFDVIAPIGVVLWFIFRALPSFEPGRTVFWTLLFVLAVLTLVGWISANIDGSTRLEVVMAELAV
ncbi:MAG: hypothetical protein M3Z16_00060, partial [Pseudomonadota bacterium]|nr:hypothetical protein [Pseudomonadota bacterium]